MRRLTAAFLSVLLVLLAPVSLAGDGRTDANDVSLFYNETAYTAGIEPMLIGDAYFVPVEMFSLVPYITLSVMPDENLFIMQNGRTGDEISALCAIDRAWINGEIVVFESHKTETDGGTYFYVDAEYIAGVMGLQTEVLTMPSGRTVLRLSDGGARLSLERLMKATVPAEFGSAAFDLPERTGVRSAVLSFIGINEYTPGIAEYLTENGIPACFFLSESDISSHPTEVASLASSGFALGIYVDSYSDITEADMTNGLLYGITMRKTHYLRQNALYGQVAADSGYIGCADSIPRYGYSSEYDYITDCTVMGSRMMTLPQNEYTTKLIDYAVLIGMRFADITFAR